MTDVYSTLPVITLNVNRLNPPTKKEEMGKTDF